MKDMALALPLLVADRALHLVIFPFARWSSEAIAGHELSLPDLDLYFVGTTVVMAHVFPLLLNGFYEELIVRGYLMTVVGKLTNSGALAIGLSVIVQVSYHFYQGSPYALSHIGWCLLFSCFYWKTKRLLPVALAHFLSNFTSFLLHGASLAG
jgi:membrane protease YdiL (CAAX protease family)